MSDHPNNPARRTRGAHGRFIRALSTLDQDAQALELRKRGLSYRAIAAELGIDVSTAHAAVDRALRDVLEEPAQQVRQLELDRLDAMWNTVVGVLEARHVVVSHGKVVYEGAEPLVDQGPVLAAVDRLLRIQERRARLLGLDQPAKLDVSGGVQYRVVGVTQEDLA